MYSNAITITRTLFTAPLFAILAFGGGEYRWIALALFLGAGALDMIDGIVARRLNETSRFGAMIDLVGDRLLTLAALLGLIAGGDVTGIAAAAAALLIARDVVVASLNEALPGRLEIRVSVLEKVKIAAAFAGIVMLMAPELTAGQNALGGIVLCAAAVLSLVTIVDYWMRALRAFRTG